LRATPWPWADFPIDYLVFSSGAGILEWRSRELLAAHDMQSADVQGALDLLLCKALAFMVHLGVPDNHHFYYHRPPAQLAGQAAGGNISIHRER
jgi:hypothetical protein